MNMFRQLLSGFKRALIASKTIFSPAALFFATYSCALGSLALDSMALRSSAEKVADFFADMAICLINIKLIIN